MAEYKRCFEKTVLIFIRCVLGGIHKHVCVTLNIKLTLLTFRGGGGRKRLGCDVMILLYWYCIFFGAIKPAHGQNMALVPRLQLGGTRIRSGRESLLGILSYVEMFYTSIVWTSCR